MKKTVKFISTVLVAVLLFAFLVSCGVIKGDTVMEYEGYKITEAMYSYWKSRYKAAFISQYGTSGSDGKKTVDWSTKLPDGRTYEEFFEDELVNSYAKKVLVCQKLFDDYGLYFTESDDNKIADIISGLEDIYGGKNELNSYLADYNLNIKTLEMIYYAEAKVDLVNNYIFANSSEYQITTTERDEYYKANYYCVNWIYIYTSQKPDDTQSGNNSDGSYILVDMTPEEKQQKQELVQQILQKLQGGQDFKQLKAEYCEDKYEDGTSKYDYYPNGFNLSANDYDSYGVDLIKQIKEMAVGDIILYDDGIATRIVVRNPLIEYSELTEQEKNIMVSFDDYLVQYKWDKIIAEANITVDTEVTARYGVKTVKAFTNLVV